MIDLTNYASSISNSSPQILGSRINVGNLTSTAFRSIVCGEITGINEKLRASRGEHCTAVSGETSHERHVS